VEGAGWSAEGDLAPLRVRLHGRRDACLESWERDPNAQLGPADAVVPLRDAAGAVRAQVVVSYVRLGGPETDRTAQGTPRAQPGVHVRDLRGFLLVR
jgi:hypothetical protein